MSNDFQTLHRRHLTLLQQRHREEVPRFLLEEAQALIYDLSTTEPRIVNEYEQQRLESYATYWRSFVLEQTGVYPETSLVSPLKTFRDPTISLVTVIPTEYAAMKVLLDHPQEYMVSSLGLPHQYLVGSIPTQEGKRHQVVLSIIAMGLNRTASHVTRLLAEFPKIHSMILVGIAGGVAYPEKPYEHVRLGDIVVSSELLLQNDIGQERVDDSRFAFRSPPRPPSPALLQAVGLLMVSDIEGRYPWKKYIDQALDQLHIRRPPKNTDTLMSVFAPGKKIKHPLDPNRRRDQPRIFVGPIASANVLVKDMHARDELRERYHIKAIEMEGAGITEATWAREVGYLVVRGIADYGDGAKNDLWQSYAAVVAAAFTRALIESIPASHTE